MNIHKLNQELHQYDELRRRLLEVDSEIDKLTLALPPNNWIEIEAQVKMIVKQLSTHSR